MKKASAVTLTFVIVLLIASTLPGYAQATTYVVQPGDTLAIIAGKYNTSASAIAAANNLSNWNLIYAGSTLIIPSANTGGTGTQPSSNLIRYIVKSGDTLSQIAVNYNTSVQAIKNANGFTSSYIYPNQGVWVPVGVYVPPANKPPTYPSGQYYWVQPGDNLFAIGLRFGVNIYRIAEANGILNLNRIYAGVPLLIPR